jgi:hypothetical protein
MGILKSEMLAYMDVSLFEMLACSWHLIMSG